MSFLDEATIKTTPEKLPAVKAAADDDDTIEVTEKKKRRPDYADVDGDGDRTEPMAKAFKDKEKGDVEEGKLSKALGGIAVLATLLGINKATSEKIYNSDPKIKALTSQYEKAKKDGDKEAMAKFEKEIEKRKVQWDTGKVDESTTLFEIDLKPLLEKHGKEGTVKLTKALMKKLHGKGEATVDGTKLVFKENHSEQDTQLALPEPPAKDFLGDDGKDYEGGMAKSQMYKMKQYADALCNMIDDESQLEAWVQAKLTKASDYMSAVYHYLDYQNSKINEAVIGGKRVNLDSLEAEDRYDDVFTYAEFEDGTPLTAAELDLLSDDENTKYSYFGPGGKGHSPQHDF